MATLKINIISTPVFEQWVLLRGYSQIYSRSREIFYDESMLKTEPRDSILLHLIPSDTLPVWSIKTVHEIIESIRWAQSPRIDIRSINKHLVEHGPYVLPMEYSLRVYETHDRIINI